MFSFFTGKRFCEDVASELGVNAALLSTALLEVGFTWVHFKRLKKLGTSPTEAVAAVLTPLEEGLAIVKARFGTQQEIVEAEEAILRWKLLH